MIAINNYKLFILIFAHSRMAAGQDQRWINDGSTAAMGGGGRGGGVLVGGSSRGGGVSSVMVSGGEKITSHHTTPNRTRSHHTLSLLHFTTL